MLFVDLLTDSPGRFFAVMEIKALLAVTLLNYDVKTKDGRRPENQALQHLIVPDMSAKILFKKRKQTTSFSEVNERVP